MIKVGIPEVQKALDDIEKRYPKREEVAPKQLRHFNTDLNVNLVDNLDEGEYADLKDSSGNYYLVWKREGKLFRAQGTEVT